MSANDLINFWEQTISKWPFSGHFQFYYFFDIYLTEKKQNSRTMNIKQNVMSHTRITHDKFRIKKIQNGRQSAILNCFLIISLGNLA